MPLVMRTCGPSYSAQRKHRKGQSCLFLGRLETNKKLPYDEPCLLALCTERDLFQATLDLLGVLEISKSACTVARRLPEAYKVLWEFPFCYKKSQI